MTPNGFGFRNRSRRVDWQKAPTRGLLRHRRGCGHRARFLRRRVTKFRAEIGARLDHREIGVLVEAREPLGETLAERLFLAHAL